MSRQHNKLIREAWASKALNRKELLDLAYQKHLPAAKPVFKSVENEATNMRAKIKLYNQGSHA